MDESSSSTPRLPNAANAPGNRGNSFSIDYILSSAAAAQSIADLPSHQQQHQQLKQHQQQQHWHHQQQQFIAAANLAAVQHQLQQQLNPLAAAAAVAASAQPNIQTSQQLAYFMAYCLLQQQQAQQQQQHPAQLHPAHLAQSSLQQQTLGPDNYLAGAAANLGFRSTSSGSPLKQLGASKNSIYDSIAALTASNQRSSPINNSSSLALNQQRESRQSRNLGGDRLSSRSACGSGKQNSAATTQSAPAKPISTKPTPIAPTTHDATTNSSTALSSLSNFVSESLAPILNGSDNHKVGAAKDKLLFRAGSFNNHPTIESLTHNNKSNSPTNNNNFSAGHTNHKLSASKLSNNGISQHRKSGSLEPEEVQQRNNNNGSAEQQARACGNSTLDLISSAAQALKSSAANAAAAAATTTTTGTIINTTLAKAPPELVQKQPAWVFCTRYSDRPSSGPRTRRAKSKDKKAKDPKASIDEKRPRTAFTSEQLDKLRQEFQANSYLDERRRKDLADRLCLNENQIKIWFQNKRAKMKKQNNQPNPLRGLLVAGGLYNHSTATSDCSESYANGNDNDGDEDDDNDCVDAGSELENGRSSGNNNNGNTSIKRLRDDSGNLNYSNENETGASHPAPTKRARLSHSGSESGSDSSRIENLDEDERVISVS